MRFLCPLFLGLTIISCHPEKKSNYPEDPAISDVTGIPKDSTVFYFPDTLIRKGEHIVNPLDSMFGLEWYSDNLTAFKEPVLYNYYLGKDCYRFLWLRSFNPPVVLTINKANSRVWLTAKKLNKEAFDPKPAKTIEFMTGKVSDYIDTSSLESRRVFITINDRIELTSNDWVQFESLLNDSAFWNAPITVESHTLDGAFWVFEGHKKDKYWLVDRHSPYDNNIFKAGKFLIEKSGLKEEIY